MIIFKRYLYGKLSKKAFKSKKITIKRREKFGKRRPYMYVDSGNSSSIGDCIFIYIRA